MWVGVEDEVPLTWGVEAWWWWYEPFVGVGADPFVDTTEEVDEEETPFPNITWNAWWWWWWEVEFVGRWADVELFRVSWAWAAAEAVGESGLNC